MYALLNAQMLGIYNQTELSLSLKKQRTGEIKHNWNCLSWKSPRCFPARVDCLCYWKCLENPLIPIEATCFLSVGEFSGQYLQTVIILAKECCSRGLNLS